jgi:hypothetical protein
LYSQIRNVVFALISLLSFQWLVDIASRLWPRFDSLEYAVVLLWFHVWDECFLFNSASGP